MKESLPKLIDFLLFDLMQGVYGVIFICGMCYVIFRQFVFWWREPKEFKRFLIFFFSVLFSLIAFFAVMGGLGYLINYLNNVDHPVVQVIWGLISCTGVTAAFYFGIKYIVTVFSRK